MWVQLAITALNELVEEQPDHPFIATIVLNVTEVLRTLVNVKGHEPSRGALAALEQRQARFLSASTDENVRTTAVVNEAVQGIEDDPAEAAATLRSIVERPSVPEHQRVRAAAGLADALAFLGQFEEAVSVLEGADASGRLGTDVVLCAGNVGGCIVTTLLVAADEGSMDFTDSRRRSLSALVSRTCDLLDAGGHGPDADVFDTLRSLTFRAVARWASGDRAGAQSGLNAARLLQVEHAATLRAHPSVRVADMTWVHDGLERAMILDGSMRMNAPDAGYRYVELSDGRHRERWMILQVQEVPVDVAVSPGSPRSAFLARWLPPLGDQLTLHIPGDLPGPTGVVAHHLDLEPSASMRQRLQQMARAHSEGATVTVAVCRSDPANITVDEMVADAVPPLVALRVGNWNLLLDEM